jgi:hypothetical protein
MSLTPGDQDQSIKARKRLLYEEDDLPASPAVTPPVVERKPFRAYLRETPAQPLSTGMKALVWGSAILVGLLFAASVWKAQQPRKKTQTRRPSRTAVFSRDCVPSVCIAPHTLASGGLNRSARVWYGLYATVSDALNA